MPGRPIGVPGVAAALRSFRHVFRSPYEAELEAGRVAAVNSLVPEVMATVRKAHAAFGT
jgi:hypothetical protein